MSRRGLALLGLLLGALLLPRGAAAIGGWERGGYGLQALGALRLTGAFLHFAGPASERARRDDGLAAAVLRLLLEGDLGPRWSYELNAFSDLSRYPAGAAGGAVSTVAAAGSAYRSPHLTGAYWDEEQVQGAAGLDRLALTLDLPPLRLRLGRQAVNYSVTNIFTPNDFFAPFSATAINKVYKPGVDALRASYAPGPLSAVDLVAALGADAGGEASWAGSALLLRGAATRWGMTGALLGGKLAGRWAVGATLQGEVGPLGLRGEGNLSLPDADGDGALDRDEGLRRQVQGAAALGLDTRLAWRNVTLGVEAFFSSAGAAYPAAYAWALPWPDDPPYQGRFYVGALAAGDLLPILRASAVALLNAQDLSGLLLLSLSYSIADEADCVAGVMSPWGAGLAAAPPGASAASPGSEFGALPLTVFLETRFYF